MSGAADWVESALKRKLTDFQRTAVTLICQAQGCGPYDFSRTFETADWEFGRGVRFTIYPFRLSTFDSNCLTRLVIGAHEHAVRVEIEPCNFRHLRVIMHPRQREGQIHQRHPTIEQAVADYRKGG